MDFVLLTLISLYILAKKNVLELFQSEALGFSFFLSFNSTPAKKKRQLQQFDEDRGGREEERVEVELDLCVCCTCYILSTKRLILLAM